MPPSLSSELAPFINKKVPLRFGGRDLEFCLSHGLFSSFDIDEGTRLLLKSLAQQLDLKSARTALDVGCGVGVIGACVAALSPSARVWMQDRDALAVAVARENCRLNDLPGATAECRLAFHGLQGRRFDLVTSNLPAKAGTPVLGSLLRHAGSCLTPEGRAAVVIVAPLAAFARETLANQGCSLVYAEEARSYSVYHFRASPAGAESINQMEDFLPYIRGRRTFRTHGLEYSLETAFAVPDFDTRGHDLELCLDLLERLDGGVTGFWNPGQGHLPVALAARQGKNLSSITIAGRDCLECLITTRNLGFHGMAPSAPCLLYAERELGSAFPPGSLDLLAAMPRVIPRSPWQDDLVRAARAVLKPGGQLLVSGTSTEIGRFLQRSAGLSVVASKKREGFRAVLLRNRDAIPPSRA